MTKILWIAIFIATLTSPMIANSTADSLADRFGFPRGGAQHQMFVNQCEEGRKRGEAIGRFNAQLQLQQQLAAEAQYQRQLQDLQNAIRLAIK